MTCAPMAAITGGQTALPSSLYVWVGRFPPPSSRNEVVAGMVPPAAVVWVVWVVSVCTAFCGVGRMNVSGKPINRAHSRGVRKRRVLSLPVGVLSGFVRVLSPSPWMPWPSASTVLVVPTRRGVLPSLPSSCTAWACPPCTGSLLALAGLEAAAARRTRSPQKMSWRQASIAAIASPWQEVSIYAAAVPWLASELGSVPVSEFRSVFLCPCVSVLVLVLVSVSPGRSVGTNSQRLLVTLQWVPTSVRAEPCSRACRTCGRAMYAGHCSSAVRSTALSWYLAASLPCNFSSSSRTRRRRGARNRGLAQHEI